MQRDLNIITVFHNVWALGFIYDLPSPEEWEGNKTKQTCPSPQVKATLLEGHK